MIAGQLEVLLAADVARISRDMQQAKGIVGSAMREIDRLVGNTKTALSAIGVGLSVAGLVLFTRHTIDAIAKMHELGIESGTTAERISRFEAPARAAGSSVDAVAAAIFRMSKASIEARDPATKAAQAFAAIGISTDQIKKLKPDELFELSARQLSKYADGAQKSAVMQELWNKSGREMSRVAAEIAERGALVATVTNEEAAAANKFNNQMVELKMNSEKLWRSLAAEGVPVLNGLISVFIKAKQEGGLLNGIIETLSRTFDVMRGDKLDEDLKQANSQVALARTNLKSMQDGWRSYVMTAEEVAIQERNVAKAVAERDRVQALVHARDMARQDEALIAIAKAKQTPPKPDPRFSPEAAAAAKKYADELQALYNRLDNTTTGVNAKFWQELSMLHKEYEHGGMTIEKYRERVEELVKQTDYGKDVTKQQAEAAKFANEEAERAIKLDDRLQQAKVDLIKDMRVEAERIELETRFMGLSNAERAKAIALHQMQSSKIELTAEQMELLANRIRDAVAAQEELRNTLSVWDEIANRGSRFFADLFTGGKKAFDSLKEMVKDFARELIALFTKRYILQIGVGSDGGVGAGSLAGSLLGSAGSLLGNLFGSTGFGAAASSFFAGATGSFMGPMLPGSAASIGATLAPYLGPLALGITALVSWLGGRKGGPKDEGTFGQTSILSGSNDQQLRTIGEGLGQAFTDFLARVGGSTTLGANPFALGLSVDPRGTSPSFLDAIGRGPNGDFYRSELRNVARGGEEAALTLETKRMLLAALQASNLPAEVAAILNSVSAVTGTAEEIDRVTAAALAWADAAAQAAATTAAAAEQMKTDWTEAQDLIDRLSGRDPSQRHLGDAVSAFEAANPWASGLTPAELVAAFKTITEEDFKAYSAENRQLILAILGLADTMDATASTVADAAQTIAQAIYFPEVGAQTLQQQFEGQYGGLIGAAPGLMGQLSLRAQLMRGQVATWQQQQAGLSQYSPEWQTLQNAIESFQQRIAMTAKDIADLAILTAQYGEAKAEELFNLRKWYDAQRELVQGNAEAMAALETIFQGKWKDILDGIAGDDAKARLADWWRGIFQNEQLSPLTPQQKFDLAKRDYDAAIAGGDPTKIQAAAQTYLEIARQIFASSAAYTAIFRDVMNATGLAAGLTQADINSRLYSALPTSSPISSSADISGLRDEVRNLEAQIENGIRVRLIDAPPEEEEAGSGLFAR